MTKTTNQDAFQKFQLFPPHIPLQQGSIIVLTGEPGVGKTTAGTNIAPRSQMAYIDCEASGKVAMAANPPAIYVDIVDEYLKVNPSEKNQDPVKYVNLMFEWFDAIEAYADKLSVVTLDNPKMLKTSGLPWAYANKKLLGITSPKTEIVWGAWNNYLTQRLQRLALKVGLLVVIVHLVDEYENEKPTGVIVPRVWEALEQAASLVFWLRKSNDGGPVPDALLIKGRASISADVVDGVVYPELSTFPKAVQDLIMENFMAMEKGFFSLTFPILPPVIRPFTWDMIRHYMNNPYRPNNIASHEIPTKEESLILYGKPSEIAETNLKLQTAQSMKEAQEAQDLRDKHVAEINNFLWKLGDKADEGRETLKLQFGKYSDAIHEKAMNALREKFPDVE